MSKLNQDKLEKLPELLKYGAFFYKQHFQEPGQYLIGYIIDKLSSLGVKLDKKECKKEYESLYHLNVRYTSFYLDFTRLIAEHKRFGHRLLWDFHLVLQYDLNDYLTEGGFEVYSLGLSQPGKPRIITKSVYSPTEGNVTTGYIHKDEIAFDYANDLTGKSYTTIEEAVEVYKKHVKEIESNSGQYNLLLNKLKNKLKEKK